MKNRYEIRDDTVVAYANCKGKIVEFTFDKDALERVNSFPNTWYAHEHRNTHYICGVWTINEVKHSIRLHRWIMNPPDDMVVDHISGDATDNRRENLRVCTSDENGQNVRTPHELPRGVKYHGDRFRAVMTLHQEKFDLGVFDTVDEADTVVKYFRSKYMPYSTEALGHETHSREELVKELSKRRAALKKPTSSQYIGVYKMRTGAWGAQWSMSGYGGVRVTKFIGSFKHEVTASIARDIAMFKYYGCNLPRGAKFNHPDLFNSSTVTWSDADIVGIAGGDAHCC